MNATVPPADALPCIICHRPLENVYGEANNQPYGGLAFQSYGHYGTAVFDPLDNSYLEINVCDSCMLAAESHNRVYIGHNMVTQAQAQLELWDYEKYADEEHGGEDGHE